MACKSVEQLKQGARMWQTTYDILVILRYGEMGIAIIILQYLPPAPLKLRPIYYCCYYYYIIRALIRAYRYHCNVTTLHERRDGNNIIRMLTLL